MEQGKKQKEITYNFFILGFSHNAQETLGLLPALPARWSNAWAWQCSTAVPKGAGNHPVGLWTKLKPLHLRHVLLTPKTPPRLEF